MMFTKSEMYTMLVDMVGIPQDSLDILIKVLGDTPQTYIKVLNAQTKYKTFNELEKDYYTDYGAD